MECIKKKNNKNNFISFIYILSDSLFIFLNINFSDLKSRHYKYVILKILQFYFEYYIVHNINTLKHPELSVEL